MALGTVITLGMDFTGPNVKDLPKVAYTDPLEASGSLMLLDMTHPMAGLPSGVPAHGATYPNMFAKNAETLLGSGSTGLLIQSVYKAPENGKVERSGKGGIHAIQSITQTGEKEGFQLRLPVALVDYFKANPTHSYYVSQWGKTTRPESAAQHSVAAMSSASLASFAFNLGDGGAGSGPTLLGSRQVSELANTPTFRNMGTSKLHGDFVTGTYYAHLNALFEVGNYLPRNAGSGKSGLHGAQIFYRGYIEDLTVSGRTYEQVDALDFAEYTKQVLTPGGRYHGDTVATDPATLP